MFGFIEKLEKLCTQYFQDLTLYGAPNYLTSSEGTVELQWLAPGHVVQSVGHLTLRSGVLGSIPGLATYYRFSFRFFKKGSCPLLAKVCA